MKMRTLVLGSVAGLSLAGILATPSFAQNDNNPPQYSSPQAVQQTQQLNDQGMNGTTQSPAELNGESNTSAPSPTQAQYSDQQQQYQQQQQSYQDQQAQYQDQRARYDHDLRQYDIARYEWTDYPSVYAYRYDDGPNLRRIYLIANPSQQLANAPVEGPGGHWVGRVRNVETGVDGSPHRVEIALNHRVSVWVSPSDLRFDADNRVVFTNLTRDELWTMPGATLESADSYRP